MKEVIIWYLVFKLGALDFDFLDVQVGINRQIGYQGIQPFDITVFEVIRASQSALQSYEL